MPWSLRGERAAAIRLRTRARADGVRLDGRSAAGDPRREGRGRGRERQAGLAGGAGEADPRRLAAHGAARSSGSAWPGEEIVKAAADCDAKSIVCTTHGAGGWAPQWFGSVTDYVIRHTLKPVLAIPAAATAAAVEAFQACWSCSTDPNSPSRSCRTSRSSRRRSARSIELFRVVVPPWVGDSEVVLAPEIDRFGIDAFADEVEARARRGRRRSSREGLARHVDRRSARPARRGGFSSTSRRRTPTWSRWRRTAGASPGCSSGAWRTRCCGPAPGRCCACVRSAPPRWRRSAGSSGAWPASCRGRLPGVT